MDGGRALAKAKAQSAQPFICHYRSVEEPGTRRAEEFQFLPNIIKQTDTEMLSKVG